MTDHINNNLDTDIAIAEAVRTFLASPAIISMIRACVTEAANAEVQRLVSDDRILNTVFKAINTPATTAESRLSDTLGRLIRDDIEEANRYLLNEDDARQFLRDELEGEPRYFTRAVEAAVDATIDTDTIIKLVKDGIDIDNSIFEYFDDDDNLGSLTRKVVDAICVSVTVTSNR
jgi:hypothetical protein